jgi:Spy/CpxP family protein refolding chaperone
MKNLRLQKLFIFGALLLASFTLAGAQNLQDKPQDRPKDDKMRPMELFRRLGLSQEQMQQIRRINQEKQPLMRDAQKRLGDANRALDIAIYADTVNEDDIQTRLKEVQAAHNEMVKIRSSVELAVRKVLTAEQLAEFRRLRDEMMQQDEERRMQKRDIPPQERDDVPNRPLNNRPLQQQRPINRPNF